MIWPGKRFFRGGFFGFGGDRFLKRAGNFWRGEIEIELGEIEIFGGKIEKFLGEFLFDV